MTTQAIKMRCNAAGFLGEAVSVFCAFDPATDVLAIVQSMAYEDKPREGFLRLTTQSRDQGHDAVFSEDDTRAAIVAFFELSAMQLIQFSDSMQRHNPDNKIERDGMDEAGVKYRISPDITNGQVAVLMAAFYARQQRSFSAMDSFMDEMITTI